MESKTVKELGIEVFSDEQKVSYIGTRQGRACVLAQLVPRPKAWREAPYLRMSTHSVPGYFQG